MTQDIFPRFPRFATINMMSLIEPLIPIPTNHSFGDRSVAAWDEGCALWPTLSPLTANYPGFSLWYWTKVLPGLLKGTRHILHVGGSSRPSGIAILKREANERKICTLWVADSNRGRGVGRDLLKEAIDWLDDTHPLFTVPAERHDEFKPLMQRLCFKETARLSSVYRHGVVEHVYNGRLDIAAHS